MFVLPLGACLAFNGATPAESTIAGLRRQDSAGVVASSAAQKIAPVNAFGRFIARPTGSSD